VGGDLYYFNRIDGRLWLAVGDVSDKGVPAALFMARAISLIQQQGETPPHQAMAVLNNALESGNDNCMFVTLFLGVLDPYSGVLEFASGGHTPPILLRSGRPTVMAQDDGPALGLASGLEFPSNSVQLCAGDRLVIYTDGIDEAFNQNAAMYGTERVLQSVSDSAALTNMEAGHAIVTAVDGFTDGAPQSDDITLMLLDFSGSGADQFDTTQASERFDLGPQLSTRAGEWLEHILEQAGTAPDVIMEMVLVQEELVTNVAKYAGLGDQGEVTVTISMSTHELRLEVRDRGEPFDPLTEGQRAELGADIDHARVGGLGVHLITQLTDTQSYRRDNNENVLTVTRSTATSTNS
jgi:sigma-B regulation protein RsbU (phosphoserine phosphatase)